MQLIAKETLSETRENNEFTVSWSHFYLIEEQIKLVEVCQKDSTQVVCCWKLELSRDMTTKFIFNFYLFTCFLETSSQYVEWP